MVQNKQNRKTERSQLLRAVSVASGAGVTLLVCMGGGLFLGHWVDEFFHWVFPAGVIAGGLLGAIVAFYSIYKQLQ